MAEINYNELNLKVGLELHRQIESKKLFCSCPSVLRDDEPNFKIKRKLRAVLSEIWEKDIVAEYEEAKKRYGVYEGYYDNTCLVETDEEPIHRINDYALKAALEVAMLLNASLVDEVQVMRKQVLDYSNTSGFQRTMLIASDGNVKTKYGNIGIKIIALEEDAARKIKEEKDEVVYRLDRLGIPLIEIVTEPEIKSPEQAKEIAEHIGMILKSTGKFKGGIGSVRQDLNLSIKNGSRIEIKGVQDLKSIPIVIENEVKRQLELIKKGVKVKEEVRRANLDNTTSFMRPMPGASRMYVETDHEPIKITRDLIKDIKIPELISEKVLKLERKYNLNGQLAREIINIGNFEDYVKKFNKLEPSFIAHSLVETPKEIKKRFGLDVNKLGDKDFENVFSYLNKGLISKPAVIEILVKIIKGEKIDFNKYKTISENELREYIKRLVKEKRNLSINALMGIVMEKYKGMVDGKKIMEILKEHY